MFKHAREFLRYLRNHQWERAENGGILLPKAGVRFNNYYEHDINGQDMQRDYNLLTTEGMTYLLDVGSDTGSQPATRFLSIYGGNYTPTTALTAASYPATASEIPSGTEGYSEVTRPAWTIANPASASATNVASKAAFTIVTASSLTIYGAALCSESAKGAVTGNCASATKFTAARTAYNTDVFNLGYVTSLTSS